MENLINVILPTLIVVLIGFLFGRVRKIDMSAVVDISLYIGLPALVFTSMLEKSIVLRDAMKVWASALIIMLGCGAVAWIVFTALKKKHSGLYIPIVIMNTVNIPFPIIYLAFGSEGLFAATLFYIPNVFLVFTLGVYIASKKHWKENIKEIFKVPLIYAAVLGLLCNLSKIHLPDIILKPLNFIGLMALPLILITLGYNLSRIKITSLPTTLLASFLRVGVGLLLGILATYLFGLSGILKSVVILDSAMPAAVLAMILAMKYDNEVDLVSSVVFVTTIISLITIPLLLMILA
ncbi:MAG TPA: AEC family transporter [Syntrophales bacterium]|nr:AEC family transporter [Syntrophales bacterium]HPQ44424.1 AEC family transporter [Syntrophales bacterium]